MDGSAEAKLPRRDPEGQIRTSLPAGGGNHAMKMAM